MFAQSIERQAIGAAGANYSNATTTMSFTLGEVITTSLTNGTIIFNQGFQQGEWVVCSETTTYTNAGWNPSIPTSNTQVIIDSDYDTAIVGASIDACEIIINSGFTLTISAGDYVKIENDILVNGSLLVAHEGSLVQVEDLAIATNNGSIEIHKITPVATGNSFSILGSPLSGTTRGGAFIDNNVVMQHDTNLFNLDDTVTDVNMGAEHFADTEGDNWLFISSGNPNTLINASEGYLVGPTSQSVIDGTYDLNYTEGTLNNGLYTFTTLYNLVGTAAENKSNSPNILSNPYASAIDADAFILNNTIVDELYFWEHLTPPNSSYPGYRSENWNMGDISIRNMGGGLEAPNGGAAPSQYIASGQGFGIKANAAGPVIFNNALRVTDNNTGYRASEIERIYLKISNETYSLKSSTLIAFTNAATDDFEPMYDSKRLATPISIYSVVDDFELAIQGRSAFNTDQIIPLGFRTMVEENQNYTISLGSLEGDLITSATVYLQDNLLHTITNLSENSYFFSSNESNQKDRFVIVFEEEQLGNNEVSLESISLYPNPTRDIVNINSPLAPISSVEVFDLRGRKIDIIKIDYQNSYQLNIERLKTAVYFIKINTEQGTITKRIIKE
jgi:hypothetical protein